MAKSQQQQQPQQPGDAPLVTVGNMTIHADGTLTLKMALGGIRPTSTGKALILAGESGGWSPAIPVDRTLALTIGTPDAEGKAMQTRVQSFVYVRIGEVTQAFRLK